MQFPYLFRETVEENLTLGRKISPDIFDKSIRIACADDFVFNKLDTIYDKNYQEVSKKDYLLRGN
ncbi:hypothetical protein B40_0932 [Lactococcus cremoris]|nr:hypothetical protein B40_0932 [Lactococcus cremoris]